MQADIEQQEYDAEFGKEANRVRSKPFVCTQQAEHETQGDIADDGADFDRPGRQSRQYGQGQKGDGGRQCREHGRVGHSCARAGSQTRPGSTRLGKPW